VIASSSINPSSTAYTVTGLAASTPYTFRIVAIDTSANRSTSNPMATATTAAPVGTVVALDDFNRADGPLGTPQIGAAWDSYNATVMSNQAGFLVGSANYPNLDTTKSDNVDIEMDLILPTLDAGNISGVMARFSAGDSVIFGAKGASVAGFHRPVAGSTATPAPVAFTFVANQIYHLMLEVRGNVYKGYIDGVLIQTYTDVSNTGNTSTRHGFSFYSTTVPRADNFKVTSF
jgi:hypothetical protein